MMNIHQIILIPCLLEEFGSSTISQLFRKRLLLNLRIIIYMTQLDSIILNLIDTFFFITFFYCLILEWSFSFAFSGR